MGSAARRAAAINLRLAKRPEFQEGMRRPFFERHEGLAQARTSPRSSGSWSRVGG
jgi:hypothetical protein